MANTNNQTNQNESEVKTAAEHANPAELKDNLAVKNKESEQAEHLEGDQKTPFIDDSLRTDDK